MREVYEGSHWVEGHLQETGHRIAQALTHLTDPDLAYRGNRVLPLPDKQSDQLELERLAAKETTRLVYKLFVTPEDLKRRVVLFAGIDRDNGCADICVRAGKALAALHLGSVCLVDANLRSPSLHELVGTDNRNGLATANGSAETCATAFARQLDPGSTNNLWVLPSGSSDSDPSMLLTPGRVKPRLQELCGRFDHVLISAPPADLHDESLALGRVADGVVLVVSANATRRDAVHRVKSRLDDLSVPVLGIVLSDRTFPIPEALYRLV